VNRYFQTDTLDRFAHHLL